jgi:hypothetical protein
MCPTEVEEDLRATALFPALHSRENRLRQAAAPAASWIRSLTLSLLNIRCVNNLETCLIHQAIKSDFVLLRHRTILLMEAERW